jgi:hypothetical protein
MGDVPPPVPVADIVADAGAHSESFGVAETATPGNIVGSTESVREAIAESTNKHEALLVIFTFTTSPFAGAYV